MRSTTCTDDNRLGLEHVKVTGTDVKSNRATDSIFPALIHQQVSNHDAVINFVG